MKPHIEKVSSVWVCMSGESPGPIQFGYGKTPYLAWVKWFINGL